MKKILLLGPLCGVLLTVIFASCASEPAPSQVRTQPRWIKNAISLRDDSSITWLPRQVSGRYDGASAQDNIRQAAAGQAVKRSSYGTAPGGYVRLDGRMLRAMRILSAEGYRFRVTSLAGASHSRTSRHYAGLAFDIDHINGQKVGYRSGHWRQFLRRCRQLGATETLGPGDKGHSTHIHAAWPR